MNINKSFDLRKVRIFLYVLITSLVIGCGGGGGGEDKSGNGRNGDTPGSTSDQHITTAQVELGDFEAPNIPINTLPTDGNLKAFIQLGDRKEELTISNGFLTGGLSNVEFGESTFTITVEFDSTDYPQPLTVASATQVITVTEGSNELSISADEYLVSSLDDDNDGVSNLDEILSGTPPENTDCVLGQSTISQCTLG